jgi:hypothetical protein
MEIQLLQHEGTDARDFAVLRVKTAAQKAEVQSAEVQVQGTEPSTHTVIFGLDISGSMSDLGADGRSKMQHVIHTTKNIWKLLASRSEPVTAMLYAFDSSVELIIPPQQVTQANLSASLAQIDLLLPRGGTNIEGILRTAGEALLATGLGAGTASFIMLTDGNANEGFCTAKDLCPLVQTSADNVFIGYGLSHSAELLSALGRLTNASYYFIPSIEEGGVVFGEIFHNLFYKQFTDVVISGRPGMLFYDFRNNTWMPELKIDALTYETNKTFHVRLSPGAGSGAGSGSGAGADSATGEIIVTGRSVQTGMEKVFAILPLNMTQLPQANLRKHLFRQRTLEALFAATNNGLSGLSSVKKTLLDLLAEMKAYMSANDLLQDQFYISLCDDLAVTAKTYGTPCGFMYAEGRCNSNGYERVYNIRDLPPRAHMAGASASVSVSVGRCSSVAPAQLSFSFPDLEDAQHEEEQDVDAEVEVQVQDMDAKDVEDDISNSAVYHSRVTTNMADVIRMASAAF